jgi:hypothetical protein
MYKSCHVVQGVEVIPGHFPIPSAGFLPVNAFVIQAKEPVLIKPEIIVGKGQGIWPPALHLMKSLLPPC